MRAEDLTPTPTRDVYYVPKAVFWYRGSENSNTGGRVFPRFYGPENTPMWASWGGEARQVEGFSCRGQVLWSVCRGT